MITKNLKNATLLLKENHNHLVEKYKIKSIGIFGSFATGKQTKASDIDILVEFTKAPNFFTFIDLENELNKILGIKVDLVTRKSLKPGLKNQILKQIITL